MSKVELGYNEKGQVCYFEDGKEVGVAEDNCNAELANNFKKDFLKAMIEEEGMTPEEAEKAYNEAYGDPVDIDEEDEQPKKFQSFKKSK